ncbi:uncharacterized protein LOC128673466 [Plodia interpunctella]|uniref:uncharacterized protein LOC128673466 n=1 Tax=Plodia interpunctella TaxID=58824 RepID=UPI002368BAC5|nr:uncharacterized protein LOC128673466 [Plodia interpunctella]
MCTLIVVYFLINSCLGTFERPLSKDQTKIAVLDLTKPTTWSELSEYFLAVEKHWKICVNCGIPGLGTSMHLDKFGADGGGTYPAVIPPEFLLTRLKVIDVSKIAKQDHNFVLTLNIAMQWMAVKRDPAEPTLLLFKFGWFAPPGNKRGCACSIPGISFELAQWIAGNLSHVVGVATDCPTVESHETREFSTRTIANVLGRSGVYMIESVRVHKKVPEQGCMTLALPLKMLHSVYVPTRLVAFCPTKLTDQRVVIGLRKSDITEFINRESDINLEDIMSNPGTG